MISRRGFLKAFTAAAVGAGLAVRDVAAQVPGLARVLPVLRPRIPADLDSINLVMGALNRKYAGEIFGKPQWLAEYARREGLTKFKLSEAIDRVRGIEKKEDA